MTYISKLFLSGLVSSFVLLLAASYIYAALKEYPKVKTALSYVFVILLVVFIACVILFPLSLIWRW